MISVNYTPSDFKNKSKKSVKSGNKIHLATIQHNKDSSELTHLAYICSVNMYIAYKFSTYTIFQQTCGCFLGNSSRKSQRDF
jgi:hypothetical protein